MKWMIAVALLAITSYVSAQTCTDVQNCDTCANPGPLCKDCPMGTVLSNNRQSCLACPSGCTKCTADANDVTKCIECAMTFYLKNSACTYCGDGCLKCHEDSTSTVVCDECTTIGYAHDKASAGQPCLACPNNCKKCSVQTDGSTKCSECYSYKGLKIRGYYLKKSDFTCKSCPTNCEKCNDDGNGVGICSNCYADYTIIADANTNFADGTKCLKCPSACKSCSSEVKTGTTAKCTECKADMGNYLNSDECTTCTTGCKNCDSDGQCTECMKKYRLDTGSCTACPAFCDTCTFDETLGADVCSMCQATYGPKVTTSVTCDSCAFSNCATCTRAADGSMSCSACKEGYILKTDKSQCVSCGTGCKVCTWDNVNSKVECTTCYSGYTSNPALKTEKTCSVCSAVSAGCTGCVYNADASKVNCDACSTGKYVVTAAEPNLCEDLISDCATGDATDKTKCTACNAKYYVDSGDSTCKACILNCGECTPGAPTECAAAKCDSGFVNKADNLECIECQVGNCGTCLEADAATKCETCKSGYIVASDKLSCKKCPSNCLTCTVSGTTTSCASAGCQGWTGSKAFVDDGAGACKSCPSKCKVCTWDSSTSSTKCTTGNCDTGYALTADGLCEACPANCNECEFDTTLSSVVCKSTKCKSGYGQKADKLCYECPYQCSVCNIVGGTTSDDTLFCDTCNQGYEENKDVCAKCPSNCDVCSDQSGTMTCTACKAGYALDSANACAKCPSNCKECTAKGTTTCKECNAGYGLSADKSSCTDCATAAFDNCALCTSIDAGSGKANCTACSFGFTLEDESDSKSCKDAGSLSCGLGKIFDNEPECSTCATGFTIEDYKCIKLCYSCGDVNDGAYVDKDKCLIPAAGANATDNDAKIISCESGICYAANKGGKVMAGCLPKADMTGTCVGDRATGETCKSTADAQVCEQCCMNEKCNTFVQNLDGQPDSAALATINLMMLVAAAFLAMRFY